MSLQAQRERPLAALKISRMGASCLPAVLGLVLLAGIALALRGAAAQVSPQAVLAALGAMPARQIVHAVEFLLLACLVMASYDLPGVVFAKKSIRFPWIGFRHIGFASFCAYSLSHVLGAPTFSGSAVRVRLYAQWGVPPAGIARIIALTSATFSLGTVALIGGILLFAPAVPLFGQDLPRAALRAAGAGLWAVIAAYVLAAKAARPLKVFGREIHRPGLALAIGQVLLGCVDSASACGVLYAVLPPGVSYVRVLAIYLVSFAAGMFSGLPGGVGVLDSLLLLGLSADMPPASALGAILLYRVLYYLVPAALGSLLFAGHEVWATVRRRALSRERAQRL